VAPLPSPVVGVIATSLGAATAGAVADGAGRAARWRLAVRLGAVTRTCGSSSPPLAVCASAESDSSIIAAIPTDARAHPSFEMPALCSLIEEELACMAADAPDCAVDAVIIGSDPQFKLSLLPPRKQTTAPRLAR